MMRPPDTRTETSQRSPTLEEYLRSRHRVWLSAAALCTDRLGRVLLIKPAYRDDTWLLPGGGVEAGESPRAGCRPGPVPQQPTAVDAHGRHHPPPHDRRQTLIRDTGQRDSADAETDTGEDAREHMTSTSTESLRSPHE